MLRDSSIHSFKKKIFLAVSTQLCEYVFAQKYATRYLCHIECCLEFLIKIHNYNRFYFIFCYLLLFFSFSQRGINATEKNKNKRLAGPTETRTRIAGFRVRSANHYTIGPCVVEDEKLKKQ